MLQFYTRPGQTYQEEEHDKLAHHTLNSKHKALHGCNRNRLSLNPKP